MLITNFSRNLCQNRRASFLFPIQSHIQNGVDLGGGNEIQLSANSLIDFSQISLVILGDDDGGNTMSQSGHGLFLQSTDGHHPAPETDLTSHGNIPPHSNSCQGRNHSGANRHAGTGAVLGNSAFREMNMDVFQLPQVVEL